jgi:hypothetical protein
MGGYFLESDSEAVMVRILNVLQRPVLKAWSPVHGAIGSGEGLVEGS